jgi:hypothetical protein
MPWAHRMSAVYASNPGVPCTKWGEIGASRCSPRVGPLAVPPKGWARIRAMCRATLRGLPRPPGSEGKAFISLRYGPLDPTGRGRGRT